MRTLPLLAISLTFLGSVSAVTGAEKDAVPHWSWQEPFAVVDARGDLTWKPRPFVFEKGDSVRYIILEPEKVWWADLNFTTRSVWSGDITRFPLARTPNWKVSNPDDVKSEWWVWDNPGKPFGNTTKNAGGQDPDAALGSLLFSAVKSAR